MASGLRALREHREVPAQRNRFPATLPPAPAAAAPGLVLRLVDFERTAIHVLTVQVLNGACSIGARHFDEPETARTARIAIVDQGNRINRTVL